MSHFIIPPAHLCFWCRKEKRSLVLFNLANLTANYDPCETCREYWRKGVVVIEVTFAPNAPNQPPMNNTMYRCFPKGRWAVVEKAAATYLNFPQAAFDMGMMVTHPEGFDHILNPKQRAKAPHLIRGHA